jgi:hypothetical protein
VRARPASDDSDTDDDGGSSTSGGAPAAAAPSSAGGDGLAAVTVMKGKRLKTYVLVAGHRFRPHYFKRFTWCDHCSEFIWGVHQAQGHQCRGTPQRDSEGEGGGQAPTLCVPQCES